MSPEEVQDVLDEIEREIPGVRIVKWRPRDEDGKIMYAQIQAQNDALERYGETVDWMAFMDMDEYLVYLTSPFPSSAGGWNRAGTTGA